MRKLICVAAALGLVAGVATTASALDFSVSGQYFLQGNYLNNAAGSGFVPTDDEAGSQSGWNHTFLMKPTLKVNDKISVMSDIRFLKDTDYGASADDDGTDMGIKNHEVYIHKIYMEYMSPVGKIRVGRTPASAWQGAYLNSPGNGDRLYFFPKMDKPWSAYVFAQKAVENDWYDGDNDSDQDVYEASVGYTTKETKWALGYNFYNNKTMSGVAGDVKKAAFTTYEDLNDDGDFADALETVVTPATAYTTDDEYDRQRHRIKGYVKQTMADLWVEAEFAYDFGDWKEFDTGVNPDEDLDTLAAMVAVGTSFDNLKVSALYFYASGDDDLSDDDMESAINGAADKGTGDGFNPYYILTGDHTGMLNTDETSGNSAMMRAGVHCVGVSADLAVSDKLTLHGALAYAKAAEGDYTDAAGVDVDLNDEYGWEVDLGASYKLLDNLTYKVEAGYLATGDFFKDMAEAAATPTDEEDLYLLSHTLTMKF